jgi:hypothetical protein
MTGGISLGLTSEPKSVATSILLTQTTNSNNRSGFCNGGKHV